MSGIADVMGRISEIRSQIQSLNPNANVVQTTDAGTAPKSASTAPTGVASMKASSFNSVLADLTSKSTAGGAANASTSAGLSGAGVSGAGASGAGVSGSGTAGSTADDPVVAEAKRLQRVIAGITMEPAPAEADPAAGSSKPTGTTGAATSSGASSATGPSAPKSTGDVTPVGNGPYPYYAQFAAATKKYDLPDGLLAGMAKTESGFKAGAVSPAGARGLMQFMPSTAAAFGIDPRDAGQSIDAAGRYMRQMLDRFGKLEHAIAAYNAGPGSVARFGGIPPYRETQNYVPKVLSAMKEYAA